MDEEEREMEDALSRRHGEASEATGTKTKRSSDDQEDIDALYEKKKRKSTRVPDLLTVETLTGPQGLVKVPNDVRMELSRLRPSGGGKKPTVAASARYALTLVESYRSYFFQLAPGLAFEDALLKAERLGSKRPVRRYLEQMRQAARNAHVEAALGKERADRVLRELHDALEQQEDPQIGGGGGDFRPEVEAGGDSGDSTQESIVTASEPLEGAAGAGAAAASQLRPSLGSTYNDDEEEEKEADFDEGAPRRCCDPSSSAAAEADGAEVGAADAAPAEATTATSASSALARRASGRRLLEDSDDEEEELGRDREIADRGAASAAAATPNRRRFVFDDEDEEEQEDDEEEGVAAEMDVDEAGGTSPPTKDPSSPSAPPMRRGADLESSSAPAGDSDGKLESPAPGKASGPTLSDADSPLEGSPRDKWEEREDENLGPRGVEDYEETDSQFQKDRFSLPLAQTLPGSDRSSLSSSESASPASRIASSPPGARTKDPNPFDGVDRGPFDDDHEGTDTGSVQVAKDGDDDDETATVIPTALTGPTQLADDEMENKDGDSEGAGSEDRNDDETATVVPTAMTGPTQLADDQAESVGSGSEEEGAGDKRDDETATVVPTAMTGPTQLAGEAMDNDNGDEDPRNSGGNEGLASLSEA
jgi:hypothetical protein